MRNIPHICHFYTTAICLTIEKNLHLANIFTQTAVVMAWQISGVNWVLSHHCNALLLSEMFLLYQITSGFSRIIVRLTYPARVAIDHNLFDGVRQWTNQIGSGEQIRCAAMYKSDWESIWGKCTYSSWRSNSTVVGVIPVNRASDGFGGGCIS